MEGVIRKAVRCALGVLILAFLLIFILLNIWRETMSTSRSTRESKQYGAPMGPAKKSGGDRDAERAKKLATKKRSAFDVADEQAAESTDAYGPKPERKQVKDNRGGLLGRAKRSFGGRKRTIEDAVEKAVRGKKED